MSRRLIGMTQRNSSRHHRQSTRLRGYDYTRVGVYSFTICARHGKLLFGDVIDGEMHPNELGRLVHAAWDDLPRLYPHIVLDEFIVMPNHVHAIIALIGFIFAQSDVAQLDHPGNHRVTGGVMNHAPTGSYSGAIHDPARYIIESLGANSDASQIDPVRARFIAPHSNAPNPDFQSPQFVAIPESRHIAKGVMNHAPTASRCGATHDPARCGATHDPAQSDASRIDRPPAGSLGDVVRGFKARATRAINRHRGAVLSGVWLRGYYDSIIRDDAHLRNARQYVLDNPRRWELKYGQRYR